MARPKSADPLIEALIKKLPTPGSDWPAERRRRWLEQMDMALADVYGGDTVGRFAADRHVDPPVLPPSNVSTLPSRKKLNLHKFYVDHEGYARRNNGDRIMPNDVTDTLYDHRGIDGDMATITWADDSTGVGSFGGTVAAA